MPYDAYDASSRTPDEKCDIRLRENPFPLCDTMCKFFKSISMAVEAQHTLILDDIRIMAPEI